MTLDKYESKIQTLGKDLETERMRLASRQDVARMVDENMKLRKTQVEVCNLLIGHVEGKSGISLWEVMRKLSSS